MGTFCFYFKACGHAAELEKQGKSVCRACADRLTGTEYPLRKPTFRPLYYTGFEAARAMDTTFWGGRREEPWR